MIKTSLYGLMSALTGALDMMSPQLAGHHRQVAYFMLRMGEQLKLKREELKDLVVAGLIHDIGALSADQLLAIIENEEISENDHGFRGAKFAEMFSTFSGIADIIKYHHHPWQDGAGAFFEGNPVPMGAHYINIADYVCSFMGVHGYTMEARKKLVARVQRNTPSRFEPGAAAAVAEMINKEYIWLDLKNNHYEESLESIIGDLTLDLDAIEEITLMFSKIIDFRSRFTARHSAGVARIAEALARLVGFSETECKLMLIAGYLHDIGKLAVSNDILEKTGSLDAKELDIIRSHTYYTYRLLEKIPNFETINTWAAYHHEKLDGTGYPFGLDARDLPCGSRIMAVADIATAILEDRPYRAGLNHEQTANIMNNLVASGAIDGNIVKILISNIERIDEIRIKTQSEADNLYENFYPPEFKNAY